jgi:hypothetical protein
MGVIGVSLRHFMTLPFGQSFEVPPLAVVVAAVEEPGNHSLVVVLRHGHF